jgi:polyisoprenoid-binding protein YceI
MTASLRRRVSIAFIAVVTILYAQPAAGAPSAIDVHNSKMTVSVYKQGTFSFLADDHQIDAPISAGSYDSATKSIELTVDAAQIKVLDPRLSAKQRAAVQETMAGPKCLDVTKYPTIAFSSTKVDDGDPSRWTITGNLTLHGQTRPVTFQARKIDTAHYSGSATVRQSTFGITPIRISGGFVSVKDDVKVDFQVALSS